jgi:hypothetical protein
MIYIVLNMIASLILYVVDVIECSDDQEPWK